MARGGAERPARAVPGVALVCVDLQNDFASVGGAFHKPRPSVSFLERTLFPFAEERGLRIAEIVSDYRQPRPGDGRDCCRPGEWGYASLLPDGLRDGKPWVKSMNSPLWTRAGAGVAGRTPGAPRPDAAGFERWLRRSLHGARAAAVFGLTLDRCVLCAAQTLSFYGVRALVLEEGTDMASADAGEKTAFLRGPPLSYWAEPVSWRELRGMLATGDRTAVGKRA